MMAPAKGASRARLRRQRSAQRKLVHPDASAGEVYSALGAWRAKHMPWLLLPGGADIFFRLITAPTQQPLHTSDLYRGADVSTPTILGTVDEMRRIGLITITTDPQDRRRYRVATTPLLLRKASCYAHAMCCLLLRAGSALAGPARSPIFRTTPFGS